MTDEGLRPPSQTRSARFAKCSFWKFGGWHTGTRYTKLSQNSSTMRQFIHHDTSRGAVALGRLLGVHQHKDSPLGIYDACPLLIHNLLGLGLRAAQSRPASDR